MPSPTRGETTGTEAEAAKPMMNSVSNEASKPMKQSMSAHYTKDKAGQQEGEDPDKVRRSRTSLNNPKGGAVPSENAQEDGAKGGLPPKLKNVMLKLESFFKTGRLSASSSWTPAHHKASGTATPSEGGADGASSHTGNDAKERRPAFFSVQVPQDPDRSKARMARSLSDGVKRSNTAAQHSPSAMEVSEKLEELLLKKAVSSHFQVRDDYKVEIDTNQLPPDLLEELTRVLEDPLFNEDAKDMSAHVFEGTMGEARKRGERQEIPKLTICILIVGTRGDVQPFIAIGKKLQSFGHRVRLASHANYREFIMKEGLEFYPLGGDPKLLAEYMVKNKGLLPSSPSEVKMQRKQLKAIINSTWPACTEADVGSWGEPFTADAIIANPPVMAHTTVAEALQVPLHVFFTMPWTPTEEFSSPLAAVLTESKFGNKLSYYVVDNLMFLGIKDYINSLRRKLKLRPIRSYFVSRHAIPYGYIWSPTIAPKPHDWGVLEDVVGFCFLDLASEFKPPQDLLDFLDGGKKPVFIGFGSLPVPDPAKLTQTIIEALNASRQRGIIQKGWGGLGEVKDPPANVLILGNCPHDWLFPKCKAVIHHGGAGTTAAGLKAGCPTTVVPFFGDQFFWGKKVFEAGMGPEPLPISAFSLETLLDAINFMLQPEVESRAQEVAIEVELEDGVEGAVQAFHKNLPAGFTAGSKAAPWLLQTTSSTTMTCCYSG